MPRLTKEFKEAIREIPFAELQKFVIEIAGKNKEVYDLLDIHFINTRDADEDLFEETKDFIEVEMKYLSGRGVIQKQIATSIGKCISQINHYAKVSKNKPREAELLLLLVTVTFDRYTAELSTCWTVFDSKLAVTTKRLVTLVTKNLHEDYFIEYRDSLNMLLKKLHSRCNHINTVFNMPEFIER